MVVSIMPCTAKKAEIRRPEHFTDGEQDVDYVLTTTEITRMIKEAGIDLNEMPSEALDMPFRTILQEPEPFWRNRRRDGSGTAPPRGQQPAGRLGEYQFYRSAGCGRNQRKRR